MKEIKWKISKEEYERYLKMSSADFNNEIESKIPVMWSNGYGWYGARLQNKEDKYYIIHNIGDNN